MKTDIARLTFDEMKHYLGVHEQMGRVRLDADANEQAEIALRLRQRLACDVAGQGSPNQGFRVDDRVLLDALDDLFGWAASGDAGDPEPALVIDFFQHLTGTGSVHAFGANELRRTLRTPRDLTDVTEVVILVKGAFAAADLRFFFESHGTRADVVLTEDAMRVPLDSTPAGDKWRVFRGGVAFSASFAGRIDAYGFAGLDKASHYLFDAVKIDLPVRRPLAVPDSISGYTADTSVANQTASVAVVDDERYWGETLLECRQTETLTFTLPTVRDLSHARRLWVAIKADDGSTPAFDFTLVAPDSAETTLGGFDDVEQGGWLLRAYDLTGLAAGSIVAQLVWANLSAARRYLLATVLLEMDLDGNLVIMGGDGTAEGAGRFYGDGLAAIKERHETYHSQQDLPDAVAPSGLANNRQRIDLAYLDLWERTVTYLQDPDLRDVALEGLDTCFRTQLVAQVRLLEGEAVNLAATPAPPRDTFAALPGLSSATLTTKDAPATRFDPCADPCEPATPGPFVGQENHLVRVEVHAGGQLDASTGTPARLKWSRENAAVATRLVEDGTADSHFVRVENPARFAPGDLIEVSDDLGDLMAGPHTSRQDARSILRVVTSVDLEERIISWEDSSTTAEKNQPLDRDYAVARHARIRRWDSDFTVVTGDIVLADGIVVEFGGRDFLTGDYWIFATRTVDRSVERLIDAPPHGVRHRYFELAMIQRRREGGNETVFCIDRRRRIPSLSDLAATEVSFQPGSCRTADPAWQGVNNVQEAIDTICRLQALNDLEYHNQALHGTGVVCGLKVECAGDARTSVIVKPGYAIDCEGHGIRLENDLLVEIVDTAKRMKPPLFTGPSGQVWLTIERGPGQQPVVKLTNVDNQDDRLFPSIPAGTLLSAVVEECVHRPIDWFKAQFLPATNDPTSPPPSLPDNTVPPSLVHKRLVTVVNLLWQLINSSSGRAIWVGSRELDPGDPKRLMGEHQILRELHEDLAILLKEMQGNTYCAMFETAFPQYPFAVPPGIDTIIGLLAFHQRLHIHPKLPVAYTCGRGNQIHIYDLNAKDLVAAINFPAADSVDVQDVAISPDGTTLHAVAIINNKESIFGRAKINGTSLDWHETTITCGTKFQRLATSAAYPDRLFALAKGVGLVSLDPTFIKQNPFGNHPAHTFNATGMLAISPDGARAYVAAHQGGTGTDTFDELQAIDLAIMTGASFSGIASGRDDENDLLAHGDAVYVTSNPVAGQVKTLFVLAAASGAQLGAVDLRDDSPIRLGVLEQPEYLLVSLVERNKLMRVRLDPLELDSDFRVPVQIWPLAVQTAPDGGAVYVLNVLNTLNVVSTGLVFNDLDLPEYTENAMPPDVLADYRKAVIDAFGDLLEDVLQAMKDCLCQRFLIDCPTCSAEEQVFLGRVDIVANRVDNICNFDQRHYVKSFRTYGYWLSAVPVLPLLKQALKDFCCKIL